jgi:TolB-like protein/Tfp pilus assembly protein PilF/class 3 adenylate cyclase
MAAESKPDLSLEIAHILFVDIVGYSKLLVDEQTELQQQLNEIVRGSDQFRRAQANDELIRLPTGDGVALVFLGKPDAPVQCAVEISRELGSHPELQLRMGIHSGPVNRVSDLNEGINIAGAGINIAQRVMDCGDAGHILLSKRLADDLAQYRQWRPLLHELGEVEMKHGVRVAVVNLYTDRVGNPALPAKLKRTSWKHATSVLRTFFSRRVSPKSATIPKPSAPAAEVPTGHQKSIAVLPFVDLSQGKDQEYFCDGISEEIIGALAKVDGLRVAARTSSFSFKGKNADIGEVGRKLHVQTVLEGSLRRDGNRIRISAQLINARDGFHLWSEIYERELEGIFAIQDEITRAIVDALRIKLAVALPAQPQRNTESYDLYLRGRFYWNKRTTDALKKAIEYFKQAIEKEPDYALAYTGLADCYSSLGFSFDAGSLSPTEAIPQATAAALKALQKNDALAEAHTSLAFIKLNYEWDWSGAEREFNRAIELNPNYDNAHHWYSHYLLAIGRTEESLAESKRALELDRLGLIINVHLGWHYLYAHQYDEAIEHFLRTLEMEPTYGLTHWYLGQAYEQKQMYEEAMAELMKAKSLLPENAAVEAEMGHVYAVSGKMDKAKKVIDRLNELSQRKYVSSYHMALIHTGLGDNDRALDLLERAYNERSDLLVYLKIDPRLNSLRSDRRFAGLLRRLGLDPARTS